MQNYLGSIYTKTVQRSKYTKKANLNNFFVEYFLRNVLAFKELIKTLIPSLIKDSKILNRNSKCKYHEIFETSFKNTNLDLILAN